MIQALPGNTLLPAAESLNYLTTIGLEALAKPDLEVFKYKQEDHGLLREIKQVITTMIRVSPDERTSSAEALPQMESLVKVCAENLICFSKEVTVKKIPPKAHKYLTSNFTDILCDIFPIFLRVRSH